MIQVMNSTALAELFGSRAAESVLLHLYHYGETYGRAVSADFEISLDSVQRNLEKFERAGVLICKRQGRTLVYSWNPKSKLASCLKDLVEIVYENMPLDVRQVKFAVRRRPRSKDKPIIYTEP
jgi:DNA-binding transcriptional ArsR family regulator